MRQVSLHALTGWRDAQFAGLRIGGRVSVAVSSAALTGFHGQHVSAAEYSAAKFLLYVLP